MTFQAAYTVLRSPDSSKRNILALDNFLGERINELRTCYDPNTLQQSSKRISIEIDSLKRDSSLSASRKTSLADFDSALENQYRIQLVAELLLSCRNAEDSERQSIAKKHVANIGRDPQFFPKLFTRIAQEPDDVFYLLQLVYNALFSLIPDDSKLITTWFELCVTPSKHFRNFSLRSRALAMILTLQFFDIHQDFNSNSTNYSYFKDEQAICTLNTNLQGAPACLSLIWALVLHKIAVRIKELAAKPLTGLFKQLQVYDVVNFDFYTKTCIQDALSAGALSHLVDLLANLPSRVHYAQTVADVLQCLTSCCCMTESLARTIESVISPYPELCYEFFMNKDTALALHLAKAKVPAALPSFVLLAQCLPEPYTLLADMQSFIVYVPRDKVELDGLEVIPLEPVVIIPNRTSDGQGGASIPAGVSGKKLGSKGNSVLVMWYFEYNCWELLGRILENADLLDFWDKQCVAIVKLIYRTLQFSKLEQSILMLNRLSRGLESGDIIDVLSHRFEILMQDFSSTEECTSMMHLLSGLVPVHPHRVWSQLLHSRLLDQCSASGFMSKVVSAFEVFTTRYDFTIASVSLAKALASHFNVSSDLQVAVLLKFVRHLVDVFESFFYWKYSKADQRDILMAEILRFFSIIIDTGRNPVSRLLIETFLSTNITRKRTLYPLLTIINDHAEEHQREIKLLPLSVEFCSKCVSLRASLNMPYSLLEQELYHTGPSLMCSLYTNDAAHKSIFALIKELIGTIGTDQPSLLAYLGTKYSTLALTSFNRSISHDLELDESIIEVCRLLHVAKRSKREGFMTLLDSGSPTSEAENGKALPNVIVSKLLESHEVLSNRVLAAMLDSLTLFAVRGVQDLSELLSSLLIKGLTKNFDATPEESYCILNLALSLRILTPHLEILSKNIRSNPKKDFGQFLLEGNNLAKVTSAVMTLKGYNKDLADRLETLFAEKFQVKLETFRKLSPQPMSFGDDYAFDFKKLDSTLIDNGCWTQHVRDQIKELSVNCGYLDAQFELIRSWRSLCVTLIAVDASRYSTSLQDAVEATLRTNGSEDLSVEYYAKNLELRAELSFYVFNELDKRKLLKASLPVLEIVLSFLQNLFNGLGNLSWSESQSSAYRALLKIANIQLGLLQESKDGKVWQCCGDLLESVCVQNIQALTAAARIAPTSVADDLTEIIILTRQCLTLVGSNSSLIVNMGQRMIDCGCDQALYQLYTYALDINSQDPIFGELALLYILEWLPYGSMASHFYATGIMSVLLDSPVSREIQKGFVTAYKFPRLHKIWSRGILTIALSLLHQLGSRVVSDSVIFLERYGHQIQTCFRQWTEPDGEISMGLIEESTLLCVFLSVLAKMGRRVSLEQQSLRSELVQALDHLSSHRKYLATRIAADPGSHGKQDNPEKLVDVIVSESSDLRKLVQITDF